MRKIAFIVVVFVFVSGLCFAADPAEGYWISVDEKSGKATAGWEIYTSGNQLFGRILSLADKPQNEKASKVKDSYPGFPVSGKLSEMTVVGTPWIFNLTLDKQPGNWSGGSIVDPTDGKIYKCKITFRPQDGKKFLKDTLEMRGEIGLGIGRSQFWQKATKDEAAGLR